MVCYHKILDFLKIFFVDLIFRNAVTQDGKENKNLDSNFWERVAQVPGSAKNKEEKTRKHEKDNKNNNSNNDKNTSSANENKITNETPQTSSPTIGSPMVEERDEEEDGEEADNEDDEEEPMKEVPRIKKSFSNPTNSNTTKDEKDTLKQSNSSGQLNSSSKENDRNIQSDLQTLSLSTKPKKRTSPPKRRSRREPLSKRNSQTQVKIPNPKSPSVQEEDFEDLDAYVEGLGDLDGAAISDVNSDEEDLFQDLAKEFASNLSPEQNDSEDGIDSYHQDDFEEQQHEQGQGQGGLSEEDHDTEIVPSPSSFSSSSSSSSSISSSSPLMSSPTLP